WRTAGAGGSALYLAQVGRVDGPATAAVAGLAQDVAAGELRRAAVATGAGDGHRHADVARTGGPFDAIRLHHVDTDIGGVGEAGRELLPGLSAGTALTGPQPVRAVVVPGTDGGVVALDRLHGLPAMPGPIQARGRSGRRSSS